MMLFSYKNMLEGQGSTIAKKNKTEYETKAKEGKVYLYVIKNESYIRRIM